MLIYVLYYSIFDPTLSSSSIMRLVFKPHLIWWDKHNGSSTKKLVFCPYLINLYSNCSGNVDIMERKQLLVDVSYVNSHVVYMKLGNDTSLLNFNIIQQKRWIVVTVIVRYRSPLVGQPSKNLMNHPCPQKSQPRCTSFRRSEWWWWWSLTRRKQDLNLRRSWAQAELMKLFNNNNHYTTAPLLQEWRLRSENLCVLSDMWPVLDWFLYVMKTVCSK